MGNNITIQVQLERDIYCPGNLVRGVVLVRCEGSALQFNGIRAVMVTQMTQMFPDQGKDRSVTTSLGGQAIPLTTGQQGHFVLKPGAHSFPFAFQLHPGQLPTVAVANESVGTLVMESFITVEAELKGGELKRGEPHEIIIISAIPAQLHQNPAPLTASEQKIVSNCCCGGGIVTLTASVDRSVVATDRDRTIQFVIRVGNDSDHLVSSVHVALLAATTTKIGYCKCAPSQVVRSTHTAGVPAHTVQDVQGALPLPMVVLGPSLKSSVLDVTYCITITAEIDGCCARQRPTTSIGPIVVAHTVDTSEQQFAALTQQAYAGPHDPRQSYSQNLYFAQQPQPVPLWQPGVPAQQQEPCDVAPQQQQERPVANEAWGPFAPPPPEIFKEHSPLAHVPMLSGVFETHAPEIVSAEKDDAGSAAAGEDSNDASEKNNGEETQ